MTFFFLSVVVLVCGFNYTWTKKETFIILNDCNVFLALSFSS